MIDIAKWNIFSSSQLLCLSKLLLIAQFECLKTIDYCQLCNHRDMVYHFNSAIGTFTLVEVAAVNTGALKTNKHMHISTQTQAHTKKQLAELLSRSFFWTGSPCKQPQYITVGASQTFLSLRPKRENKFIDQLCILFCNFNAFLLCNPMKTVQVWETLLFTMARTWMQASFNSYARLS